MADAANPEPPADATPSSPAGSETAGERTGKTKRKRAAIVRRIGLLVLAVLALGVYLTVELWLEGHLAGRLRDALASGDLELAEDTRVTVGFWSARAEVVDLRLHERRGEERHTVFAAERLVADLGLWESLTAWDLVIDELVVEAARASARRFPDGELPRVIQPPAPPDANERVPGRRVDWFSLYEAWKPRLEQAADHIDTGEEQAVAEEAPPRTEDRDWEGTVRYQPFPGERRRRVPRLLIRELTLEGTDLDLPDRIGEGEASPLDIAGFSVEGTTVTPFLDPGEETSLQISAETAGAGRIELAKYRRAHDGGALRLRWGPVPLALLADPRVSGERLATYGPAGTAELSIDATWNDGALTGEFLVALHDPRLEPTAAAGAAAREAAALLDRMRACQRQLRPGEALVIPWRLHLGGRPWAPIVTGMDAGGFLEAVKAGSAELAKRMVASGRAELVASARKLAEESGRDLQEIAAGEKDPEEALEERRRELEDTGEDLEEKAERTKDFFENLGRDR